MRPICFGLSFYNAWWPGAIFDRVTVDEVSALHGTSAWQVQQRIEEGCVLYLALSQPFVDPKSANKSSSSLSTSLSSIVLQKWA